MQEAENTGKAATPPPLSEGRKRRGARLRNFANVVSELATTYRQLKANTIEPRQSNARVYVLSALCDAIALADADRRLSQLEQAVAHAREAASRATR